MSYIRKKHKKIIAPKIAAVLVAFILLFTVINTGIIAALVFVGSSVVISFTKDLPDIKDFSPIVNALTSRIYAADGKMIGTLHGEQNREIITFEQIPKNIINAVVSIEDERFYQHNGIDFEGIFRSLLINLKAVSYTHLRAHETDSYLVCRLLLEK